MKVFSINNVAKNTKTNVLPFKTEDFRNRTQIYNPKIGKWVKRDTKTGLFTSVKGDGKPWGRIKIEDTQIVTCRNADLPPAA